MKPNQKNISNSLFSRLFSHINSFIFKAQGQDKGNIIKFKHKQYYWASVKCNQDFINIKTYSGLRMTAADPEGESLILAVDSANQILGEAILLALSKSRTFTPKELKKNRFFNLEKIGKNYQEWIENLKTQFGYKTKRALFKEMKSCSIDCYQGKITLSPTYHEKLEGWSGDRISDDDYVVLPVDSSPEELGAGLRLALSRCQ